ncbi:T9SS type A sorting domain-containing protein [Flammeovirga aprica]|uniref:T9SS type A sorting domain-containing protein n=1 Tax=Flammeovirga aprica JL-4 TaxID=694437 RepID=A0A7X9RVV5_9BACT|nr:T9SS type A sorting domain-containing protein [Flammeovirga aprica]NME69675.1 T9SS type A sorting domain-containing protein [Flammeovirga aprica JL-4]
MKRYLLILGLTLVLGHATHAQDKTGDYWTMVALYLNPANSEAQSVFNSYRNENKGLPESVVKSGWEEFSEIYTPEQIFNADGEVLSADQLPNVSDFIEDYDFVGKLGLGGATSGSDGNQRITKFDLTTFSLPSESIKKLPSNIGNLTALTLFNIRNQRGITTLPESFATLTKVHSINIKGNGFEYFPPQISRTTISESPVKDPNNGALGFSLFNIETQSPRMKNIPSAIFNGDDIYIRDAIYLASNAFSYGEVSKFLTLTENSARVRGMGAQRVDEVVRFYGDISGGMTYTISDRHHVEGTEYKWINLPASASANGRSITFSETGVYASQTRNLELSRTLSHDPDLTEGINIPFYITIQTVDTSSEIDALLALASVNNNNLNWNKSLALEEWEGVTFDEKNKVATLNLAGKGLTQLIDLSVLTSLTTFDISNNSLTFTEILKVKDIINNPAVNVSYSQQKITVGIPKDVNLELPATLVIDDKDIVGGNAFQWKKGGEIIAEATNETLIITEEGDYSLEISHTDLPELTFTSETISVLTKILSPDEKTLLVLAKANEGKLNWSFDLVVTEWEGVTINEQNEVTAITIAGKGISQLIDLSSLTELKSLDISNNALNFTELMKMKDFIDEQGFSIQYVPQNVALNDVETASVEFPYTLTIDQINELGADTYQWFKDGILIENSNNTSLEVTSEGVYKVEVTNSEIPNLSFTSEEITIVDKTIIDVLTALSTANPDKLEWDDPAKYFEWEGLTFEEGSITAIDISAKGLTKLTDLSSLRSLQAVNISNNELNFTEILKIKELIKNQDISVNYLNQNFIFDEDKIIGIDFPYSLSADNIASVGGDLFQWYNGEEIIENASEISFEVKEGGVYSVVISHSEVPGLTFTSSKYTLKSKLIILQETLLTLASANPDKLNWSETLPIDQWEGITLEGDNLTGLNLRGKGLSNLIDLSLFTELSTIDISDNKFTFIELLKVKEFIDNQEVTVNYSGQSVTFGNAETLEEQLPSTFSIDGTAFIGGDTYQWYKDDLPLSNENSISVTITDGGNYTLLISNKQLPNTSFLSEVVTINKVLSDDEEALLAVADANPGQLNWSEDLIITAWEGVTIDEQNKVTNLNISGKNISILADLSALTALSSMDLSNNSLNFTELLKVKDFIHNEEVNVSYLSQDLVLNEDMVLNEVFPYTLSFDNLTATGADTFSWYKDGEKIEGNTIATLNVDVEGTYKLEISNTEIPGLTFTSGNISIMNKSLLNVLLALSNANAGLLNWNENVHYFEWEELTFIDGHLTELNLSGKDLTTLIDLSLLTNLTSLDLSNNALTFTELLKVIDIINDDNTTVKYLGQNISIGENQTIDVILPYTITFEGLTEIGGDTYKWYRNGKEEEDAFDSKHEVSRIGNYKVEVTNSEIPDLVITTNTISLQKRNQAVMDALLALSQANPDLLDWHQDITYFKWEGTTFKGANLIELDLSAKSLKKLTDLSALNKLISLDVSNNALNFSELLKVKEMIENEEVSVNYSEQHIQVGKTETIALFPPYMLSFEELDSIKGTKYQWYKDEEPIEGGINTYYDVNEVGDYKMVIMHHELPDLTFTSETVTFKIDDPLSTDHLDPLAFSSYPNPTQGIVYLNFQKNTPSGIQFSVFNAIGKQMLKGSYHKKGIDLTAFPSGIYYINVTIENSSKTIKVIKK